MNSISSYLFKSVDARNLSIFRILFGLVMIWEQSRLFWQGIGYSRYINTVFHFKYSGFSWVKQFPDEVMYFMFGLSILASITFTLGYFFRYSSFLLFIIYTYLFLLDVSYWNNHYYLYVFILLLFSLTRANQMYSIDASIKGYNTIRISNWQNFAFKFLIAITLVFGAFSKLINPDWFSNLSMSYILSNSFEHHSIDASFDTVTNLAWVMTIGGFLYDLLIIPLLLWKRTFWLGVVFALIFNLSNHLFLNIGSFPWAMIGSLVLFYNFKTKEGIVPVFPSNSKIKIFLSLFIGFHLLMPLRHFLIDGQVFWTSEGKVGAWHMMSGSSIVNTYKFNLIEKGEDGETISSNNVDPSKFLNRSQLLALGQWPQFIPQFAKFLKTEAELAGFINVEVYCNISISRNGRALLPIVDYSKDLSQVSTNFFKHNEYILLYLDEE